VLFRKEVTSIHVTRLNNNSGEFLQYYQIDAHRLFSSSDGSELQIAVMIPLPFNGIMGITRAKMEIKLNIIFL
jgi:hypothetical protein